MTTAHALLKHVREIGVEIFSDGNNLKCIGKRNIVIPIIDDLRAHKTEILKMLKEDHPAKKEKLVCYCCKGSDFWLSTGGKWICRVCHPPAHPSLEVRQ